MCRADFSGSYEEKKCDKAASSRLLGICENTDSDTSPNILVLSNVEM